MAGAEPRPSVIVSHVDIVYRVFAGARPGGGLRGGERRRMRKIHAVKDISFVTNHGESVGVIGRNGSGKSTLLRTVAGLVPPTSGEVWADGTPSLLGVNAVLVKQLSGARNIYIGAQALGLSRAEVDEVFDEIVEFSGIGDAIHLPMSTYSSGMAARLRFAISTAAVPKVLVIDEALATGDADFRTRSQQRIEKLRDQAGTVFLVSHSAATIRSMCDRALWLEKGRLVMDGPVEEVVDAYAEATQKSLGKAKPIEPDVPGVERWSGDTRYHTSARTARWGTPGPRDTVVLAPGDNLPLALAALPAAAKVGAPLLLSVPTRLIPVTRKEVERLEPQRAVLLGSDEVLGEAVVETLAQVGVRGERLGGDDGVAVSLALLADVGAEDGVDTVYLVPVDDSAAALVAALRACDDDGRVLLVDPVDGPTPEHVEVLERVRPRRLVVVADAGVLPDRVVDELGDLAAEGAERLLSPTAVQAAADAAESFSPGQVGVVYVASYAAPADAVCAAAVATLSDAPLLLVERDEVPPATHTQLERLAPSHVVVVGGQMAVSAGVRQMLAGYLSGEERLDDSEVDF